MSPFSYSLPPLLLSLLLVSTTGFHIDHFPVLGGRRGGSSAIKGGGRKLLLGGWQPIENLQDRNVVEIAEFAVEEHNKQANSMLMFGGVFKGEQQVVSGMNYRLYISVNDRGNLGNYVAVVYVKPWQNLRSLTSFERLG